MESTRILVLVQIRFALFTTCLKQDTYSSQSGLLFKRGKLMEINPVELESTKRSVDEHLHTVKRSPEHVLEPYSKFANCSLLYHIYILQNLSEKKKLFS